MAFSVLVYPTVGLLLLRVRQVKRGAAKPVQGARSRLLYFLAAVWAAGPLLFLGDRGFYAGGGFRDALTFAGTALACWFVAMVLAAVTSAPPGAAPAAKPRPHHVLGTLALIAALITLANTYPPPPPAPIKAAEAAEAAEDAQAAPPRTTPTPTTTTTTTTTRMPNLLGKRLPEAEQTVLTLDAKPRHEDRSPLARDVWSRSNWTVVQTDPAAGSPLTSGERVQLYLLKNEEAAWFAKHPTMPRLKPGADALDVRGDLHDVYELIELRYAKGKAPKDADTPDENHEGWEPDSEKAARAGLKKAWTGLVVGSVPPAKTKLRTGRLLVITVREKPDPPSSGGGSSGRVPPRGHDDDDDFNVPGWLCPTRFC